MNTKWFELSSRNRPSIELVKQGQSNTFYDTWFYNEHADAGQWDRVLKDKWQMLVHYNQED